MNKLDEIFEFARLYTKFSDGFSIMTKTQEKLKRINEVFEGSISDIPIRLMKEFENGNRTNFDKFIEIIKDDEDRLEDFRNDRNLIPGSDEAKLINLFEIGQYELCYSLITGLAVNIDYGKIDLITMEKACDAGTLFIPMRNTGCKIGMVLDSNYSNPSLHAVLVHGFDYNECVKCRDRLSELLEVDCTDDTPHEKEELGYYLTLHTDDLIDRQVVLDFIFNYNL